MGFFSVKGILDYLHESSSYPFYFYTHTQATFGGTQLPEGSWENSGSVNVLTSQDPSAWGSPAPLYLLRAPAYPPPPEDR